MSLMRDTLLDAAESIPDRIALQDANTTMTYRALSRSVEEVARQLGEFRLHALGLLADNGLAWALADLSALCANVPLVPLPLFFSPHQMMHVIQDAGVDGLLTDRPQAMLELLRAAGLQCQIAAELAGLTLIQVDRTPEHGLPIGTIKVTYTSGTTGDPKGVCLRRSQIEAVVLSLRAACAANDQDHHLCLTPLSTLLENLGGLYVPLLAGARVCLLPLQQVGLRGASELDVGQMLRSMHAMDVTSVILAPQMLHAMVAAGNCGTPMPPHLRFVAVGGAPVPQRLLMQAQQLGLPVFEGYGLSECASVVALNTPDACRPGSVGRPLPHMEVSIAEDGEILIGNPGFLGYLGYGAPQRPWPTGDLGYLDPDGFLHLTGRKKSMFITSFGRNVSPEWVERELTLQLAIAQAAVFGEAKPFNVAVIVPRPGFSPDAIEADLAVVNQLLPDYARISAWIMADAPFSIANNQLTANGRLKREAIFHAYVEQIEPIYQEDIHVVF